MLVQVQKLVHQRFILMCIPYNPVDSADNWFPFTSGVYLLIKWVIVMLKKYVSLFLCIFISFTFLSACSSSSSHDLQATDELIIYGPPGWESVLNIPITQYENLYPDVNILYKSFGNYSSEAQLNFEQELYTELMAGKGPDVLLYSISTFPDVHKVFESGVLYNIDILINKDSAFSEQDYIKGIMEGGYYNDARYFIPLSCSTAYLVAQKEQLNMANFQLSETFNFCDWADQAIKYLKNPSRDQRQTLFDPNNHPNFHMFLMFSGVPIINYETKEICIDSHEFQAFVEFYKAIYPYTTNIDGDFYTNLYDVESRLESVIQGDYLFDFVVSDDYIVDVFQNNAINHPDILFTFPTFHYDEAMGMGGMVASINNSSRNKKNAYDFIKILLSPTTQDYVFRSDSILKSSKLKKFDEEYVDILSGNKKSTIPYVQSIKFCVNFSKQLEKVVYTELVPYFEDKISYEEAINSLFGKLELYLYE